MAVVVFDAEEMKQGHWNRWIYAVAGALFIWDGCQFPL